MRRHWKRIVAGMTPALLAAIVPLSAQVAKPDAAAADPAKAPKVVLVELFTSEGCSSCPPADALLRQIDGKHAAGQLIVGISEHGNACARAPEGIHAGARNGIDSNHDR